MPKVPTFVEVPNPSTDLTGFVSAVNSNLAAIEVAMENAVFRTGDDMNAGLGLSNMDLVNGTVEAAVYSNAVLHPWNSLERDVHNPLNTYSITVHKTGYSSLDAVRSPNTITDGLGHPTFTTVAAALDYLETIRQIRPDYPVGYTRGNGDSALDGWLANANGSPGAGLTGAYTPAAVYASYSYVPVDVVTSNAYAAARPGGLYNGYMLPQTLGNSVYIDQTFTTNFGGNGSVWGAGRIGTGVPSGLPYQFGISDGVGGYVPVCVCAILTLTRSPGAPSAAHGYITGTDFKVLQTFQEGTPPRLPLNPCLPVNDPRADRQEYWEAAYIAAVANGTMAAGMVYGVDYPTTQSWAYYVDPNA